MQSGGRHRYPGSIFNICLWTRKTITWKKEVNVFQFIESRKQELHRFQNSRSLWSLIPSPHSMMLPPPCFTVGVVLRTCWVVPDYFKHSLWFLSKNFNLSFVRSGNFARQQCLHLFTPSLVLFFLKEMFPPRHTKTNNLHWHQSTCTGVNAATGMPTCWWQRYEKYEAMTANQNLRLLKSSLSPHRQR